MAAPGPAVAYSEIPGQAETAAPSVKVPPQNMDFGTAEYPYGMASNGYPIAGAKEQTYLWADPFGWDTLRTPAALSQAV